jgi:hypothetical protein
MRYFEAVTHPAGSPAGLVASLSPVALIPLS